jgi:hypothetical protein
MNQKEVAMQTPSVHQTRSETKMQLPKANAIYTGMLEKHGQQC